MANTEKEFELEGHTLPTAELLAEAARLVDLARSHAMPMRAEGLDLKHYTELDQMRDMVQKEHNRVEAKPPKPPSLSKEQERVVARAFQWRANLVRRVDRAYADDRYARLKFHRLFQLHRLPERLYEELFLLVQIARQDLKRLAPGGVTEELVNQGEDLCYELQNLPVPDRKALAEFEQKLASHRYGPPPKKPEEPAKLPAVTDSAKALSILKGRLYLMLKNISYAGQVAFTAFDDKDAAKAETLRRDFMLRVKPVEDDEELITCGRLPGPAGAASARAPAAAAAASPAASPAGAAAPAPVPPPAESKVMPMEKVTSKPGGANPPPGDPLKKPPPRAVGLVRPSATVGSKGPGG